nr:hypothetical protein [Candidatus Sumerlaeota bacterium]
INPTPRLMTLRFQVNTPAFSSPYSITVEAISALVDPLVQTDMSTPIAVTFDNIVTTAIGGPITIAGNVTVSTQLVSGNSSIPGNLIDVDVVVSANNSIPLSNPGNFALRVIWDSTSLTFIGASDGDLGMVHPGPVEMSFLNRFVDITCDGNPMNVNLTPRFVTLHFQVNNPTFTSPYSIAIGADPDAPNPVLATDLFTDIPAVYDYSATSVLGLPIPVAGNVTVSTQLVSGNPSMPGNLIDVDVVVSANNTIPLTNPGNFALRAVWDSTSLTFIGASDGDLGMVHPGPVEMSFLNRFVDITCDGNPMNVNLTPRFVTLHFQVNNPTFTSPYSIAIGADPGAVDPVLATDLVTGIPAVYDYSATSVLGLPVPVTGNVTVSTKLESGNPSMPGDTLEIGVVVSANNTVPLTNPGEFAIRVIWNSTSLTYVGAVAGDLGDLNEGGIEASFTNRFI